MDQIVNPTRCCLACGSKQYTFRGRKKLQAEDRQPAAVETRYACKACGHGWRERVAVKAG